MNEGKRALIVKDARTQVIFKGSHFEITPPFMRTQFVGIEQVGGVYLNYRIDLKLYDAVRIAQSVPLFFIRSNGRLYAKMSFQV